MLGLAGRIRPHRAECFLALAALVLYAPGIVWGLPNAIGPTLTQPWGHDDITPLGPLTELRNTLVQAKENRYLAYPLLHYGVVGIAYSPYLVYLLTTGGLQHPGPNFPYGLHDPAHALKVLTLIARGVTLAMAVGIVLAAYRAARIVWDQTCGVLAAVFAMLLYPMFYYSRTGNLDVPALFWGSLGLVMYAKILREGYVVRSGIWLGTFAALSAGTKDQGATLFLLLPFVLLPMVFRAASSTKGRDRWLALAATLVAGLLVYAVASGFVFQPSRYFAHVAWVTGHRPDSPELYGYPTTWAGTEGLLREVGQEIADSTSGPLLVAALVGIVMVVVRRPIALALLVPPLSVLVTFLLPVRVPEMRYSLPISFVVVWFAAVPVAAGLRSRQVSLRVAAGLLTGILCILPLLRGLELTHAMLHDSRYDAAQWLNDNASVGAHVEFFGPDQKLPRLKPGLELSRAVPFVGSTQDVHYSGQEIQAMAAGIAERAPEYVLVIPDHSSLPEFPYGITCPNELYDRLRDGSLGYRLSARFETPPLIPWVRRPALVKYPVVNPPVQIFTRLATPAAPAGKGA
jgi:hypothetical protein